MPYAATTTRSKNVLNAEPRERAKTARDGTDGSFLWYTQQNHLVVNSESHARLLFRKLGPARSQDYIEVDLSRLTQITGFWHDQ
jgi:hypothetical protein